MHSYSVGVAGWPVKPSSLRLGEFDSLTVHVNDQDKLSPEDFVRKIEWEGGLYDAIASYGLTEDHLDRTTDPDMWDAVRAYRIWAESGERVSDRMVAFLEEYDT